MLGSAPGVLGREHAMPVLVWGNLCHTGTPPAMQVLVVWKYISVGNVRPLGSICKEEHIRLGLNELMALRIFAHYITVD